MDSAAHSEDRMRRRLETVLGIVRRLASEPRLDPLLESIAQETCNLLDAERSTLFLYSAPTDELYSRVVTKSEIEEIRFPASRGIAGAVAHDRAVLNIPDAYDDPRFNPQIDKETGWRTRSILAVPMTNLEGELVGVLEAMNHRGGAFTAEDERLAEALAAQAGVALERARLLEEFLAKRRLENEMELARDIQRGLLPEHPPKVDGFDFAGATRPSEYAGGDFYDLFPWGEGRVGLIMGDAVGHGVGPALLAAETRALVRAVALREAQPDAVLADVNRLLAADVREGRFVTLVLASLDARTGMLRYASAGQGPLLLVRADGASSVLKTTGLPLGILEDAPMRLGDPVDLAPGDRFVVVSDGIIECETAPGEDLGLEAVIEACRHSTGSSAQGLIDALMDLTEKVGAGRGFRDDRTAVVAARTRPAEGAMP